MWTLCENWTRQCILACYPSSSKMSISEAWMIVQNMLLHSPHMSCPSVVFEYQPAFRQTNAARCSGVSWFRDCPKYWCCCSAGPPNRRADSWPRCHRQLLGGHRVNRHTKSILAMSIKNGRIRNGFCVNNAAAYMRTRMIHWAFGSYCVTASLNMVGNKEALVQIRNFAAVLWIIWSTEPHRCRCTTRGNVRQRSACMNKTHTHTSSRVCDCVCSNNTNNGVNFMELCVRAAHRVQIQILRSRSCMH